MFDIELITYNNGTAFYPARFNRIKNSPGNKPLGGLWSSPVNCSFGWVDWCVQEEYGNLRRRDPCDSFVFRYAGEVLKIDTLADMEALPWIEDRGLWSIDFERLCRQQFGAIYLTEQGQNKTSLSHPINLYGWDCETVLILNPQGIIFPSK